MNIRALAFDMADAVESFKQKAKRFFYQVMLLAYRCPKCNGSLVMLAESQVKCASCNNVFDPTIAFQRCSNCGGVPELQVRHYRCRNCKADIQSRFLFDGFVFNTDYFRQKMVESRQRKQERREKVRQMLAETRSNTLSLPPADLGAFPDLIKALNRLTADPQVSMEVESKDGFDLHRYETHIQAHIQEVPTSLMDIPPLSENLRRDLIWRFIAVIFMAHAGEVDIWQEGPNIMLIKYETNRKRQGLPGDLETIDGLEGSMGRAETC
ncbi:hypothetical protein ACFL6U_03660 [Planctomycetota bacterium]